MREQVCSGCGLAVGSERHMVEHGNYDCTKAPDTGEGMSEEDWMTIANKNAQEREDAVESWGKEVETLKEEIAHHKRQREKTYKSFCEQEKRAETAETQLAQSQAHETAKRIAYEADMKRIGVSIDEQGVLVNTLAEQSQAQVKMLYYLASELIHRACSDPNCTDASHVALKARLSASPQGWLQKRDAEKFALSCRELINLIENSPETGACTEPWESVRKAVVAERDKVRRGTLLDLAEKMVKELGFNRAYACADWLRERAQAQPAEDSTKVTNTPNLKGTK